MFSKMIKHEFLEGIKSYIYVLIGGLVASLLVGYSFYQSKGFIEEATSSTSALFQVFLPLIFSLILVFILIFGFFFQVISNFKRDLFTDSRLLKFSLPVTSSQFFWAKVISVFLAAGLILIILLAFNLLQYKLFLEAIIKDNSSWSLMSLGLSQWTSPKYFLLAGVNQVLSYLNTLTMAYFSIVLVKAFFKNSKSGNAWFIVFLILSFVLSLLSTGVLMVFPKVVEFNPATNSLLLVQPPREQFVVDFITQESFYRIPLANYFLTALQTILFSLGSIQLLKRVIDY